MAGTDLAKRGYISRLKNSKFDIIPSWNFMVDFNTVLNKIHMAAIRSKDDDLSLSASKLERDRNSLSIKVKGVKFPELQFQQSQFSSRNTDTKFPTKGILDSNLIIKFYPDTEYFGPIFHYDWVSSMVDLNTMIKYSPSTYLSDIKVHVYNRNGWRIQTRTLHDCYPEMIETGDFDKMNLDYHDTYTMNIVVTGGMTIETFTPGIPVL